MGSSGPNPFAAPFLVDGVNPVHPDGVFARMGREREEKLQQFVGHHQLQQTVEQEPVQQIAQNAGAGATEQVASERRS